jgi:hypothetical protein
MFEFYLYKLGEIIKFNKGVIVVFVNTSSNIVNLWHLCQQGQKKSSAWFILMFLDHYKPIYIVVVTTFSHLLMTFQHIFCFLD